MLSTCQPDEPTGSQPFFSAIVVPAGTPPDTPQSWPASTCSISDRPYCRDASSSTGPG